MATEFGDRLKKAREHKGLNPSQAAPLVGMKQPSLHYLESTGQGSKYVHKFAEVYGVNARWLATGEGEMLDGTHQATQADQSKHSAQAQELAALFDLIPEANRIGRAKAYTKASQAILDELQATSPVAQGLEKLTA